MCVKKGSSKLFYKYCLSDMIEKYGFECDKTHVLPYPTQLSGSCSAKAVELLIYNVLINNGANYDKCMYILNIIRLVIIETLLKNINYDINNTINDLNVMIMMKHVTRVYWNQIKFSGCGINDKLKIMYEKIKKNIDNYETKFKIKNDFICNETFETLSYHNICNIKESTNFEEITNLPIFNKNCGVCVIEQIHDHCKKLISVMQLNTNNYNYNVMICIEHISNIMFLMVLNKTMKKQCKQHLINTKIFNIIYETYSIYMKLLMMHTPYHFSSYTERVLFFLIYRDTFNRYFNKKYIFNKPQGDLLGIGYNAITTYDEHVKYRRIITNIHEDSSYYVVFEKDSYDLIKYNNILYEQFQGKNRIF